MEEAGQGEITAFVMEMRSRIHNIRPPDQLESEALIRSALGDTDVVLSDIDSGHMFGAYNMILGYASVKLALSDDDIRNLILESERLAFERGWNPPLAE